jgi:hypothetical protein
MTDNRDGKGSGTSVQVVVALISLAGVLGGALFANWDKIFQLSKTSPPPTNSVIPGPGNHHPPEPDKPMKWTSTVNTPNGILLYDVHSGSAAFEQFDASGNRSIITPYPADTFSPGWTHIVNTPNGILFYNTDTGEAVVGKIDNLGNYTVMKKYPPHQAGSFAPGWTNIVDTPEGIRYKNAQTGAVAVGQIDPDGNRVTIK